MSDDANRFSLLEVDRDPAEVRREDAAAITPALREGLVDAARDAVLDALEGRALDLVEQPRGDVFYRTTRNVVGPGLVICQRHLKELAGYRFAGRAIQVRAVGVRERVRGLLPIRCGMCGTCRSEGNHCYNDACGAPLHPNWPAVYCSDECALEDA